MLRRKRWWTLIILILLVASGGGYYGYMRSRRQNTSTETTLRTTRVRTGSLVLSTTGSGRSIAAREMDLAFASGGVLLELNVKVGDHVAQGDILARVDDLNARREVIAAELQVVKAQLDLETARQEYEDLLDGATEAERLAVEAAVKAAQEKLADLADGASQAELAAAEAAVAQAQEAYQTLVNGPDAQEIEQKELELARAKNSLWAAQMSRDARGNAQDKASGAYDQAQANVLNAEIAVRQAEISLAELKQPASQAALQEAKAKLLQAQEALRDLKDGPSEADLASAKAALAEAEAKLQEVVNGPSETEKASLAAKVRQAELTLEQAELTLEAAKETLEGTVLRAPFAGTIMAVNAQAGERVGTGTIIQLADLSQPLLEVLLDEEDLAAIAVGQEAEVTFGAMPDQVFKGSVIRIDPGLTNEGNVTVVRTLVQLDPTSYNKPQGLPTGLNATVDIIGGRAENAVLVPVEALREIGTDEYGVFVVIDGELEFRTVEVGLIDLTYAEIRSGLNPGEIVSTGIVETKS